MEGIFGAIIFSALGIVITIIVCAYAIEKSLLEIAKEIRRK
jgi:uncharacterized membrane protein